MRTVEDLRTRRGELDEAIRDALAAIAKVDVDDGAGMLARLDAFEQLQQQRRAVAAAIQKGERS